MHSKHQTDNIWKPTWNKTKPRRLLDEPEIRQRENGPEDDSFHAEEKPQKISLPTAGPLSGTHVSCAFQMQNLLPANSCRDHCNSQLSAWRPQSLLNQALRVGPLWPGTAFEQRLSSHQKKSNFHFYWRILSNVKWVQMKKSHSWNGLSLLHSHLPVALKTQPSLIFHPSGASILSLLPFLSPLFPFFSTLCPLMALSSLHDPPQQGILSSALIASPTRSSCPWDLLMLFSGALEDDFCLQRRLLEKFIFGFKNGVSLLKLQIHRLWFFLRLLCSGYKSYYSIYNPNTF